MSVAEEQHKQLEACAQSNSTNSESDAEEHEGARPTMITASAEIANISWQCAALLRKAVFNTVPGTFNVRGDTAAQTPSITLSGGS